MVLGGLWHGAGWGFLLWGMLHGGYLCINHFWRFLLNKLGIVAKGRVYHTLCILLTFFAVVLAWVPFRATSLDGALAFYKGMAGLNGIVIPDSYGHYFAGFSQTLASFGISFGVTPFFSGFYEVIGLTVLLVVVWFMPNSNEFTAKIIKDFSANAQTMTLWQRRRTIVNGLVVGGALAMGLISISELSEFLYFQF
jgi:alginate O-acetyltransferase complex protein AlgI